MKGVKKSFVSICLIIQSFSKLIYIDWRKERSNVIKKTSLCDLPSFCHISWDTNERSSPNVYSFQGAIKASLTAPQVNSIVTQSSTIPARELMEERKREINAKRRAAAKSRIERCSSKGQGNQLVAERYSN